MLRLPLVLLLAGCAPVPPGTYCDVRRDCQARPPADRLVRPAPEPETRTLVQPLRPPSPCPPGDALHGQRDRLVAAIRGSTACQGVTVEIHGEALGLTVDETADPGACLRDPAVAATIALIRRCTAPPARAD